MKKKELSYRHMLVAAMPIQILLFLIDKKLLRVYLDTILSYKYSEQIVFSLIARRDLEEENSHLKSYYIKQWIDNLCLTVTCNNYENFI